MTNPLTDHTVILTTAQVSPVNPEIKRQDRLYPVTKAGLVVGLTDYIRQTVGEWNGNVILDNTNYPTLDLHLLTPLTENFIALGTPFACSRSAFNRTPQLNEMFSGFNVISGVVQYFIGQVTDPSEVTQFQAVYVKDTSESNSSGSVSTPVFNSTISVEPSSEWSKLVNVGDVVYGTLVKRTNYAPEEVPGSPHDPYYVAYSINGIVCRKENDIAYIQGRAFAQYIGYFISMQHWGIRGKYTGNGEAPAFWDFLTASTWQSEWKLTEPTVEDCNNVLEAESPFTEWLPFDDGSGSYERSLMSILSLK